MHLFDLFAVFLIEKIAKYIKIDHFNLIMHLKTTK